MRPRLAFGGAIERSSAGVSASFETTLGTRARPDLQLFAEGGRILRLAPPSDPFNHRPLVAPGASDLVQRLNPVTGATGWYGTGGARWLLPSRRRLHPYAEAGFGLSRLTPRLVFPVGAQSTEAERQAVRAATDLSSLTVPVSSAALGVKLDLGYRLMLDAGYRYEHFFGEVDANRSRTFVGVGLRF